MTSHLTPEEATARAFGLDSGKPHCDDCARRIEALRADRARLAGALEESPSARARFPRLISALAAALCLAAVGYAVLTVRDPGVGPASPRQDAQKWIAELGSEDPAVRDRATQALAEMGPRIEGLLKKSLLAATDAETKARLGDLLARIEVRRIDRLAVGSGAAVRILKTDGTLLRELRGDSKSDVHVRDLAWSPDGAWLAFLGDNVTPPGQLSWPIMDLHVADAATGRIRIFARKACTPPVWSPDSKLVAVGAGHPGEDSELHVVSTDDWKELPLKAAGTPCFWSGPSLVIFTGAALEKLDPATGKSTRLCDASSSATSDGSKAYVFLRNAGGKFDLQAVDLGKVWSVTLLEGIDSEYAVPPAPQVSPDGQWIAFERRGPEIVAVRVAGGKPWTLLNARAPLWAPDGRLAYQDAKSWETEILRAGLPEGEIQKLPGSSPAWAPAQEKK